MVIMTALQKYLLQGGHLLKEISFLHVFVYYTINF